MKVNRIMKSMKSFSIFFLTLGLCLSVMGAEQRPLKLVDGELRQIAAADEIYAEGLRGALADYLLDDSAVADNYVLSYDLASKKLIFVEAGAGASPWTDSDPVLEPTDTRGVRTKDDFQLIDSTNRLDMVGTALGIIAANQIYGSVGAIQVFYANDKGFRDYGLLANLTVNLDNSMSASDIQTLIDACPKYIPYGKTLAFQFADGTYTMPSQLTWEGFHGGGDLKISGNTGESGLHTNQAVHLNFSGQDCNGLYFEANNIYVYISNLKISIKTNTSSSIGIYASRGNTSITPYYNYILGNNTTHGVGLQSRESKMFAFNNYVSFLNSGLSAYMNGELISRTNDEAGVDPKYGLKASYNGTIAKRSTQPTGSIANEFTCYGGVIR